jgi:uncharacterized delta-60 repeat protein
LAVLAFGLPLQVYSQTPDVFNPEANDVVYTLAVQPDGMVLVGGYFTKLCAQPRNHTGRLHADGTLDITFDPDANGWIESLAVQVDGKIVIGGGFTAIGGQPRSYIARLNADGTPDATFNPGADSFVRCLALQPDGKILVGGDFGTLGGQTRNHIARLNADGTLDPAFKLGSDGTVFALALQADGKILVGGGFGTMGGQPRSNIARVNADGTLDVNFSPGASDWVCALAVQADGKILVGGYFGNLGGQSCGDIGRLNSDGTLDTAFNPGATYPVATVAVQADGRILTGEASTGGATSGHSVRRYNSDGTEDSVFNLLGSGWISGLAVQSDGQILVGGGFSTLGGEPRSNLGRLNNPDSATEELRFYGSSITWQRGGASPEIWGTSFEVSTNGMEWVALGPATRIPGGWQLTALSLPTNTTFRARGSVVSGGASSWYVEAITGQLAISVQPLSRTNNAGTVAEFGVVAGGMAPLGYRWCKDGASLQEGGKTSGVCSRTLTVIDVLRRDAAGYSVIITNASGCLTSRVATLSVLEPFISADPVDQVNPGEVVVFSVTAAGTPPLSYQWRKDGIEVVGATSAMLAMTNVQAANVGSYDVVVTNVYGSATSSPAALALNPLSTDSFNPGADTSVRAFAVQADGKVLMGGNFTHLGAVARDYLGRFNADGTLDAFFDPSPNGAVYALAVQGDGKILAGGDFGWLGSQGHSHIGRLNADGTLDASFNPSASGPLYSSVVVYSLVVQADDKILVGGSFTTFNGQPRSCLARLNPDGSLDSTFNPEAGIGSSRFIRSLALQPDGKILVGGEFGILSGQPRNNIGRLNVDGTLDASFSPGADAGVECLAVQADGKILASGWFATLGGQARGRIGRLNADGTLDMSFSADADGSVNSMALEANGKVLVGGQFGSLRGQTRTRLGRLNSDGSLDRTFSPGVSGGVYAVVYSLALQPDGKILVGGDFTTLAGESRSRVGRLSNTDAPIQSLAFDGSSITWRRGGGTPEVWSSGLAASTDGNDWLDLGAGARITGGWGLTGLSLPTNTTIRARGFVTGGRESSWFVETLIGQPAVTGEPVSKTNNAGTVATFSVLAGSTPPFAYQWLKGGLALPDGGNISGVHTPMLTLSNVLGGDAGKYSVIISNSSGSVTSQAAILSVVEPVIVGQPLSQLGNAGDTVEFNVATVGTLPLSYQWRKDGTNLPAATAAALTLTNVQWADRGGYDVMVASKFGSATSVVATFAVNLAIADAFDPGANGPVYAIAVQPDGRILVGGAFTNLDGQTCSRIARLNADGTLEPSFNAGLNTWPDALAVQTDGKILVGGSFTTLAGEGRKCIGRLNVGGSLDTAFDPGADGTVYSLVVQLDGSILVGGSFTSLDGQTNRYMGRLNADGILDGSFSPAPNASVRVQAVQPDGKILAGGTFTTLGGQPRNHLGRLNPDGTLDVSFNPGANGEVNLLAVQANGQVLVGGAFTTLAGQPRNRLGRLNPDGTIDTTFNPGADDVVLSLALQADGKILLGGSFNTLGGQTRSHIGRLNSDGTVDSSFNPGADNLVGCLALQADGKVLAAGSFTTLGSQKRSCVGRLLNSQSAHQELSLDGLNITWLRSGAGPELSRTSFETSTNGMDWVSLGAGTRVTGGWQLTGMSFSTNANVRARGSVVSAGDSSWFVETSIGPLTISLQPVSRTNTAGTAATFRVLSGGTTPVSYQWCKNGVSLSDGGNISGVQTPLLTLSNLVQADAGAYSVVMSNVFGSATSAVAALIVIDPFIRSHPVSQWTNVGQTVVFSVTAAGTAPFSYQWRKDGTNCAGATGTSLVLNAVQWGDRGGYDVVVSNRLGGATSAVAVLAVNLTAPDSLDPGANGAVTTLAVQTDARILVGGEFTTLGGQTRNHLGRLNGDGTLDTAYDAGVNGNVYSLAVQPDGKILVAGSFTSLGGETRASFGRLNADGTIDTVFRPHTQGSVYALAMQADGKIVVGGGFIRLSTGLRNCIGRVNTNGTLDGPFNPGANTNVCALAIQADGKILVGGEFTVLGGQTRNCLGRLNPDGTLDVNFDPGASDGVYSLAVQADGKILVGGSFFTLGGEARSCIARLNADGTVDSAFDPGADDRVSAIALQADGKILVAGRFHNLAGQPNNAIGRLNADGTADTTFNPGASGYVSCLALQPDGKVLAGGSFTALGGQTRDCLGRLNSTSAAPQSLAADGSTITWLRGGSSPEVWRTTFELSMSSGDWLNLGDGIRVAGGWQFTGVDVPANSVLRARGFVAGGCQGSDWFVESTRRLGPLLLAESWRSNEFTFNIRALAGDVVVIEASTNLATWVPIKTNLASAIGQVLFSDAESGRLPRRFYRVRLHEGPLPPLSFATARVQSNRFGFNLAGIAGQTAVIEISSNLLNWTALTTNILGTTPFLFWETGPIDLPRRFYRATWVP